MPEDGVEYESFKSTSIDSLLAYESKYYLQLYLDNCAYKTLRTEVVDYLMTIYLSLVNES